MDFRFDSDELEVTSSIAKLQLRHFPIERFRSDGSSLDAWRALSADGWFEIAVAAEDGGTDMPLHLQCACAREAGRALNVEGWVNNAALLPRLVAAIVDPGLRAEWMERLRRHPGFLLADGRPATVERLAPDATSSRWCYGVAPDFDAYVVSGADHALELTCVRQPTVTLETLGDLALDVGDVALDGGERVTAALSLTASDLAQVTTEAAAVHSAALVGLAERAAALTVEYVKERKQFGVPIGQFQALQHILADVHVVNEVAWNSVLHAALRGHDDPWAHAASRIQAGEAALAASKAMLQLYGGIGFTWEADVHYFLKTAAAGVVRFGSPDDHARELGRMVVASR